MAVEVFANLAATTVTSGGTDAPAAGTQETWTVASSSSFPAVSSTATPPTQCHVADIAANSEMIAVTNISGTTWTVTRGAEGSSPVTHSAGFTVYQVTTAGACEQLRNTDWLNAVTMFGASNTGAADPTADINLALAAVPSGGGSVYLPAGTYELNGSTALALSVAGTVLRGDGYGATTIKIGSSFSATEVVSVAAPNCTVRDLAIIGASSTIASNPACNGIEIQPGSYQYTIQDVFTQYVNGYSLEGTNATGYDDISHSVVDRFWSYNCAGSIHYNGDLGSGAQSTVGVTLSNISIGGGGTATGANANLDAILMDACSDLVWTNCLIGVGSAGTGHCIHIKGNCSAVYFTGFDAGGYPGTLAGSQCGVLIEEDSNSLSGQRIRFSNGTFQTFGQGAEISGAVAQVGFTNVQFIDNVTHGCQLSGTGTQINFSGCTFSGNGSGAAGTNYDLNNSGTAQGTVRDCHFLTETGVTVAAGPGVQWTVGMATGGTALNFEHCDFRGTLAAGSYLTYAFSNLPHIFRNCANVNPWGNSTVTVTASGTATGALHYDAMFYITAADAIPGQFLCAPSSYAPGSQTALDTPAATTVASGSNGGEISAIASWSSPSAGVLDVASTTGYPASGTLSVVTSTTPALVTYTGTSGGNSFTGCAYVSGSATGTVATGGAVSLASMAPFSSTNVNTGSFTAPASGDVLVTVSFVGRTSASGAEVAFGLAAHGTLTPVIGNIVEYRDGTATTNRAYAIQFLVTGLTAGSSYNFDLMGCALSGDQFQIYAYGQSTATPGGGALGSGNEGAPVLMSVQSVGTSGGCAIVRNSNGQGGGSSPSVTIPPGQTMAVFVPAATNITPTYTDAPTWFVDGV